MNKNPIGFNIEQCEKGTDNQEVFSFEKTIPKKSIVQVYFPSKYKSFAYYNDSFDLQIGDIVYVEGKLEGIQGKVIGINYSFKIKLSEYKRVIFVVDTNMQGEFYMTNSHILAFEPNVMPYETIKSWFKAPHQEDEYVTGENGESFLLNDIIEMNFSSEIVLRGSQYYSQNKVLYICVDGCNGKAIVEGNDYYDVEFTYQNGEISNLYCSCYCSFNCKHEVAVILQLKEILEYIEYEYKDMNCNYFSAISKSVFVNTIIRNKNKGKLKINL